MPQYKFFVNNDLSKNIHNGLNNKDSIIKWFIDNKKDLSDSIECKINFSELSEQLLLEKKKDFFIWDDILKAAEMTFFNEQTPLEGPSADICCGYGFWTSKMLGKIDLGIDLFPDEGGYNRSIEGFVEKDFIDHAYRSVLQADVTKELPLPKNYFKSIISVCALEHIEEVSDTLKVIKNILANDGKLYLSLQTNIYMEKFEEIFSKKYSQWVRNTFMLHTDRTWEEWSRLLEEEGFIIEKKQFILPSNDVALKGLTYWEDPFSPVFSNLNLEKAIKEIPDFRKFYFDQVNNWSNKNAEPNDAAIVCFICSKKN